MGEAPEGLGSCCPRARLRTRGPWEGPWTLMPSALWGTQQCQRPDEKQIPETNLLVLQRVKGRGAGAWPFT